MAANQAPHRSSRRKGPRPRHVPRRMCVSCRERDAKRGMTRVVRTTAGPVEIDPTGRKNGRGAYLCSRPECWRRAIELPLLARALKAEIRPENMEELRTYAASLPTSEVGEYKGTPEVEETNA